MIRSNLPADRGYNQGYSRNREVDTNDPLK